MASLLELFNIIFVVEVVTDFSSSILICSSVNPFCSWWCTSWWYPLVPLWFAWFVILDETWFVSSIIFSTAALTTLVTTCSACCLVIPSFSSDFDVDVSCSDFSVSYFSDLTIFEVDVVVPVFVTWLSMSEGLWVDRFLITSSIFDVPFKFTGSSLVTTRVISFILP